MPAAGGGAPVDPGAAPVGTLAAVLTGGGPVAGFVVSVEVVLVSTTGAFGPLVTVSVTSVCDGTVGVRP
jgi:hypothetical protein